jgi:predicted nucleic acid-binding protein
MGSQSRKSFEMDGKSVLVDTNVLIYLLGGHRSAADLLADCQLYFSFITEFELLSFRKLTDRKDAIRDLLKSGTIVHSDAEITSRATSLRRQYGLEVPDALIVATAIRYDLPLVSADRLLSKVRGISLIQYVL